MIFLLKKCDAKRPFCHTCHIAGKELDCEYDEEMKQNLATALLLRTQELEERLALYESRDPQINQQPTIPSAASLGFDLSMRWQDSSSPQFPAVGACLVRSL